MKSPLHEWFKASEEQAANLAAHLGVTPSAVSQWKDVGVPLKHINAVSKFTGNKVTTTQLIAHVLWCREARAKAA